MSAQRSLGRCPRPEEMGALLDVVREELDTEGESHEVLGGVEWKNGSWAVPVSVRISPEGQGARLSVAVDRGGAAFLSHYVPILWGLGIAGIVIGVTDPAAWQATAGILAVGAASGYSLARTIWTRTTRKWQRVLRKLTTEIGRMSEGTPSDGSRREPAEPFPS